MVAAPHCADPISAPGMTLLRCSREGRATRSSGVRVRCKCVCKSPISEGFLQPEEGAVCVRMCACVCERP